MEKIKVFLIDLALKIYVDLFYYFYEKECEKLNIEIDHIEIKNDCLLYLEFYLLTKK